MTTTTMTSLQERFEAVDMFLGSDPSRASNPEEAANIQDEVDGMLEFLQTELAVDDAAYLPTFEDAILLLENLASLFPTTR